LDEAFTTGRDPEGGQILLIDDLFQSGATMNVAAQTLKRQGLVKSVYAIALTRTGKRWSLFLSPALAPKEQFRRWGVPF